MYRLTVRARERSVFVLMDCSENQICHNVVGVFDHADIGDSELTPYFGGSREQRLPLFKIVALNGICE